MACAAEYITRVDGNGVLLHYQVGFVPSPRPGAPSDRERQIQTRAVRELRVLEIIFDHLDISDLAAERVWHAIRAIRTALDSRQA